MSRKKISKMINERIKYKQTDKLHLLLVALVFISLSFNIGLYKANINLRLELNDAISPEAHENVFETVSPITDTEVPKLTKDREVLTVRNGDTLSKILSYAGIDASDINGIITACEASNASTQLQIGQTIELEFDKTQDSDQDKYYAKICKMRILSNIDVIEVEKTSELSYVAKIITTPVSEKESIVHGIIKESLYSDAISNGVTPNIVMDVINKFSYNVDFQRDIKNGDQYSLYYSSYMNDAGKKVRDGYLMYAALKLNGSKNEIFMYKNGKNIEYFNRNGESIRKILLKTPINGARISSGYGNRKHPILGYSRMHKGLDYGAPKGTPILAAGDGIIEVMKYTKNGYGKYLKIRHTPKYGTLYGHMDRYAKGLKVGSRVSQGDIIGYVGSTGLATGPHLHYEVHVDGAQVNPAKISFAKAPSLSGQDMMKFREIVQEVDRKLALSTGDGNT